MAFFVGYHHEGTLGQMGLQREGGCEHTEGELLMAIKCVPLQILSAPSLSLVAAAETSSKEELTSFA